MNPIKLFDTKFSMKEDDTLALSGKVFGHPSFPDSSYVHVSTPTYYDKVTKSLTTSSGRIYLLVDPSVLVEKEIMATIERGSYKTH